MDLGLEALTSASAIGRDLHRPEFFKLSLPADRERLREVLKRSPGIQVFNELRSQLIELVRSLNPSIKYTKAELDKAAESHLGATPPDEYGLWVFYPWSNRLLHLLDEAEFTLVRTDRNRNKITREEQARLAQLKVGVIGLSVGQSVALTMAQERGFGELRIADFDTLELSNLNRIRSGVHSMGHLKTVNVAREIAEIDPFLKVTLFNAGLTRDNIDRFFTEGGKLDILVDECDSVDVKIFARQKAKALRIPVVMDTSDRGMLDVERFDLEPDRPILHGLIDHLNPDDAAKAKTNEEKLPFVLPILNIDTLSKRMKASMLEIESSVTTWPQLASSVVLGGALGAEYCRRIALGQTSASGRWFMNLESVTGEAESQGTPEQVKAVVGKPSGLSWDEMARIAERLGTQQEKGIGETNAKLIVEAAAIAPSAGNNQPWRFMLSNGRLLLFHDTARSFSQLDGGGMIPSIGLGACMENMLLKAREIGIGLRLREFPLLDEKRLVAEFSIDPKAENGEMDPLSAMITVRCTNRKNANGTPIAAHVIEELGRAAAQIEGYQAHCVTSKEELYEVARLVGAAERIRILNPIGHEELFGHEIRWTQEDVATTRDGLDLATLEMKLSEQAGLRVAADQEAIRLLRVWNAGTGFTKMSGDGIRGAAAVCLISAPASGPLDLLRAGRGAQRMWLCAAKSGLAVHPISAPVFLAHHIRFAGGTGFSLGEREELLALFTGVKDLFHTGDREPVFMVRLGHADPPTARSLRRPINELYHVHQTLFA